MPQVGIAGNIQEVYGSQVWANWFALGPQARNLKTWSNFEDFIGGIGSGRQLGIWMPLFSGAGALTADTTASANRPGRCRLDTGTTNTGYASIGTSYASVAQFAFSAGMYVFESDIYIPTLSAVAEEYILRIGFHDNVSGDANDGAYFEYDRLTNVNWLCKTANGGVRTADDSGVAVGATAWIRLKIVVNYAGSSVEYYINDVLVDTIAANIPDATDYFKACFSIVKSAGATSRYLDIDWVWLWFDLTATR